MTEEDKKLADALLILSGIGAEAMPAKEATSPCDEASPGPVAMVTEQVQEASR